LFYLNKTCAKHVLKKEGLTAKLCDAASNESAARARAVVEDDDDGDAPSPSTSALTSWLARAVEREVRTGMRGDCWPSQSFSGLPPQPHELHDASPFGPDRDYSEATASSTCPFVTRQFINFFSTCILPMILELNG
jgi:hypothetical protein